jgi:hypothetical protein
MKDWQKRTKRDINFYSQGVRKSVGKLRQQKMHFCAGKLDKQYLETSYTLNKIRE